MLEPWNSAGMLKVEEWRGRAGMPTWAGRDACLGRQGCPHGWAGRPKKAGMPVEGCHP